MTSPLEPRGTAAAPARAARAWAGVAALLLLGAWAGSARAITIETTGVRERQGRLEVAVRVSELFPPRVQESLDRGMPATLQVSAELWRRRTGWFDRLSATFAGSVRVRYDVWTRTYRIESAGMPARTVTTIDSVAEVLSSPMELPLAELRRLPANGRYYVVTAATLKPLTVEDVEEGEGWLSGEVEDKRKSGIGVLTAIPRSIFDAVRNFAGLGDQRARSISDDFRLDNLE